MTTCIMKLPTSPYAEQQNAGPIGPAHARQFDDETAAGAQTERPGVTVDVGLRTDDPIRDGGVTEAGVQGKFSVPMAYIHGTCQLSCAAERLP